jgi:hypothetical protein
LHEGLSDLTFGVEVEFSGVTREHAAQVLVKVFGTTSARFGGWDDEEFHIPDQQDRIWKIVKDGSIDAVRKEGNTVIPATDNYKCELVSAVLKYTDLPILLEIIKVLKREGAYTGANCGIHVHIGAERFTPNSLRTLCNLVYRHQYLLNTALGISETRKARFCADLSEGFIESLNRSKPKTMADFAEVWYSEISAPESTRYLIRNESRYRILNLHALLSGRLPSVEYRMFNGSLDVIRIKSYIQLCLLISDKALQSKKTVARIAKSDNDRFTFRVSLLKLNAIGSEFRDMRLLLLKQLHGGSGRRHPKLDKEAIPSKT